MLSFEGEKKSSRYQKMSRHPIEFYCTFVYLYWYFIVLVSIGYGPDFYVFTHITEHNIQFYKNEEGNWRSQSLQEVFLNISG